YFDTVALNYICIRLIVERFTLISLPNFDF
ncbi:hypothetical protein EZS27_036105, partial [termite gut metagenome]